MNPKSALAIALLALSLPAAARAESPAPPEAKDYAFLVPGQTTPEDAIARLGKPEINYEVYVIEGEIDVLVTLPTPTNLRHLYERAGKRKVVAMRSLEWPVDEYGMDLAKLIFHEGRLLYAIVPPSPSESTPEKLAARHGGTTRRSVQSALAGHIETSAVVHLIPERGVGVMRDWRSMTWKIVFAPTTGR